MYPFCHSDASATMVQDNQADTLLDNVGFPLCAILDFNGHVHYFAKCHLLRNRQILWQWTDG